MCTMIKLVLISFLLISVNVLAAGGDKSSGCGIGWNVTKNMTTSASATRSSTNGTFSNTFGMTSGTSGCDFHSIVKKDKTKIHFVESNLSPLKYEVALGFGERLDAAGQIFGCSTDASEEFRQTMKQNSRQIFGFQQSAESVVNQMDTIIANDTFLRTSCLI